jgi:hypothetical protein
MGVAEPSRFPGLIRGELRARAPGRLFVETTEE